MTRAWRRIAAIVREHGLRAALRFLFRKVVFQNWRTYIYSDRQGGERQASDYPDGLQFCYFVCWREAPAAVINGIRAAGGEEFLFGLEPSDSLWVLATPDWQRIAGWGATSRQSKQIRLLGLPARAVLLGGGYIVPSFRNKGLHRKALNDAARKIHELGGQGWLEVTPENIPSIRSIEAAGFVRCREFQGALLLRRIVYDGGRLRWLR